MNLQELENKTILLFGKSRAFDKDEFNAQMKYHKINILKEYEDGLEFVVEGRMMTPYEQNMSAELYETKDLIFLPIDNLEVLLAASVDEDTLLMSLKLSHDKERLKSFLQNSCLSDGLFFKLLKMYSWNKEDFFENDNNRDVSAALILRFYHNIERNHNVQYATTGILHLVAQTSSPDLLEVLASLEPLSFHPKIAAAIATHILTPKTVLKKFIKGDNNYVKTLIAMRTDCDGELQSLLFRSSDDEVLEALSYNVALQQELIKEFLKTEKLAKNMARHMRLSSELFELFKIYPVDLAKNETLNQSMQEQLVELHNVDVNLSIAFNNTLDKHVAEHLVYEGSEDIKFAIYENSATPINILEDGYENPQNRFALAHNKNTPKEILTMLFNCEDERVLMGLAKNESTPIEVLYQLQLDSRFERAVKTNAAFGKHIQTENIGWL